MAIIYDLLFTPQDFWGQKVDGNALHKTFNKILNPEEKKWNFLKLEINTNIYCHIFYFF